jgi:putative GTP pyrophosphokinase
MPPTEREHERASEPVREPVREAVRAYAARQPQLTSATAGYVTLVRTLLDDAGIDYLSVTGRTKSVASFSAKANRTEDGRPLYAEPLTEITDQIGVRVITYVHSDVAAVADLLADELVLLDDRDLGEEMARSGRFGYASRHLLVRVREDDDDAQHPELGDHRASVQVRTVLQHAWAEFEHDIRYKGNVPDDAAADLDRRFTLAAGLIELADREFSTIRARIQAAAPGSPTEPEADHIVGQELATFLAGHYSDAGWSHTDHYDWIADLLAQLGIDTIDDLADLLTSVDADAVIRRMGYRYPAGAVRRLDDALLAVFGEQYVTLEGNSHRVPKLRARLEKLSSPEG